jgi:hypothetical protein
MKSDLYGPGGRAVVRDPALDITFAEIDDYMEEDWPWEERPFVFQAQTRRGARLTQEVKIPMPVVPGLETNRYARQMYMELLSDRIWDAALKIARHLGADAVEVYPASDEKWVLQLNVLPCGCAVRCPFGAVTPQQSCTRGSWA